MNWDAIGAVAELAGAIGVILSLVYLAVQIRMNTKQMESASRASRGAAYQNVLSSYQSFLTPIAVNKDLAEIFRQGLLDGSQLNESDFFRFNWVFGGYFTDMDNAYYQYQDGVVSETRWQLMQRQLRFFVESPGFIYWWATFEHSTLSPEFVEVVESEVAKLNKSA